MTNKQRRKPSRAAPAPATTHVALSLAELELLARVLQSMPVKGTPDSLTEVLPLIQGVRVKIAMAALLLAPAAAEPEAAPEEKEGD